MQKEKEKNIHPKSREKDREERKLLLVRNFANNANLKYLFSTSTAKAQQCRIYVYFLKSIKEIFHCILLENQYSCETFI